MNAPIVAIVGIGPGNGRALVERFHAEGCRVAMLTRSRETLDRYQRAFDNARGFECDATDADSVKTAFEAVRREMGAVDVLVYNAGAGVWGGLDDVSPGDFEDTWRVNALGLFHCAGQVVASTVGSGFGAIMILGAGAAGRGDGRRVGADSPPVSDASRRFAAQSSSA